MDDYARGFDSGCSYMLEEMKRWREINPNKTLDDLIALLDSMENNERKPS